MVRAQGLLDLGEPVAVEHGTLAPPQRVHFTLGAAVAVRLDLSLAHVMPMRNR